MCTDSGKDKNGTKAKGTGGKESRCILLAMNNTCAVSCCGSVSRDPKQASKAPKRRRRVYFWGVSVRGGWREPDIAGEFTPNSPLFAQSKTI